MIELLSNQKYLLEECRIFLKIETSKGKSSRLQKDLYREICGYDHLTKHTTSPMRSPNFSPSDLISGLNLTGYSDIDLPIKTTKSQSWVVLIDRIHRILVFFYSNLIQIAVEGFCRLVFNKRILSKHASRGIPPNL